MQNQALTDLLRRWLRGETRASEQSRLERATQDDPFLADAWEGFNQNPQADHLHNIEALQSKIAARVQNKQRKASPVIIWLPRLAAAAAVLLLLTFSWKWLFSPAAPEDLAIQIPKTEAEATPQADSTVPEVADVQVNKPKENTPDVAARRSAPPAPQPLIRSEEEKSKEVENADDGNLALVESTEAKPKADAVSTENPNNAARASGNAADKDLAKVSPPPAATRDVATLKPIPTVGGIVLDDRGQRALGIPVQRDANTFAITNREGSFELPSAAPAEVQVVATDFETQSLRLDNNDEKVVLQRKTKAQKKSFDASDRREGVGYPSPIGGFEKFEQYIKDNLEMPFEAKKHMMGGTVTLEFTFEKDGTPTRFNILRGLGFGCDQAAQHLIENGPQWKNVKPGTWVIYKVVFK